MWESSHGDWDRISLQVGDMGAMLTSLPFSPVTQRHPLQLCKLCNWVFTHSCTHFCHSPISEWVVLVYYIATHPGLALYFYSWNSLCLSLGLDPIFLAFHIFLLSGLFSCFVETHLTSWERVHERSIFFSPCMSDNIFYPDILLMIWLAQIVYWNRFSQFWKQLMRCPVLFSWVLACN